MADLPNTPIATVPSESPGDPAFPSLVSITVADLVGPLAANRQHNQQKTRTETLRDRVNKIIADLTFIETGGPGSLNAFLPRDGGQAMAAALNFGGFKGVSAADPTVAQDVATKAYVDANDVPSPDGYIGEVKWVRGSPASTHVEVEFCRVYDTTGAKLLAPASNNVIDSTTTGAGGLDTGVRTADTWYFIWAIGDSTGANPDEVLLSLSPGAPFGAGAAGTPTGISPALPAGYDLFRRIGAIRTDSSNNFISARKINGVTMYEDITRTTIYGPAGPPGGTYQTLATAAYVPPTAERCILWAQGQRQGGVVGAQIFFRSGATSPSATLTAQLEMSNDFDTHMENHIVLEVDATVSRTVSWRAAGSIGSNTVVRVRGFIEDMKHST